MRLLAQAGTKKGRLVFNSFTSSSEMPSTAWYCVIMYTMGEYALCFAISSLGTSKPDIYIKAYDGYNSYGINWSSWYKLS